METRYLSFEAEINDHWVLVRLNDDGTWEFIDDGEEDWNDWLRGFCVAARKVSYPHTRRPLGS